MRRSKRNPRRLLCAGSGVWLAAALALPVAADDAAGSRVDLEPWKQRADILHGSGETRIEVLAEGPPRRYRNIALSPLASFSGIRKSMTGPISAIDFPLHPEAPFELLWITGYEVTIVDPDGKTALSPEFNCHSNLISETGAYWRRFPSALNREEARLFTVSEGLTRIELPEGFAIPVRSQQKLQLQSQALNLNVPEGPIRMRHRTAIDFTRDKELRPDQHPKPLIVRVVSVLKPVTPGEVRAHGGHEHGGDEEPSRDDAAATTIPNSSVYRSPGGDEFQSHWLVEPGREESRSVVTEQLALPFDTSVHYAAAHLHPFAESLALYDRSAGRTVFVVRAQNYEDRIGLSSVDAVSSAEGFPLYASHEYELVSIYDNTTAVPRDAMATLFLYLRAVDLEQKLALHRK